MNGFLQEYGLNIVAVIIVLAFIVFASVFGDTITGGINDITSDFFAKSGVTADIGGDENGDIAGGNDEEEQYQLSGMWKFNNTLIAPKTNIEQNISFSHYFTYDDMNVERSAMQIGTSCWLGYDNGTAYSLKEPGPYGDFGWHSTDYMTVDFGLTPQEVSPEFYEWFTANATKQ